MLRFLRLLAQVLVLIIIALASALISMRFAIHGREVAVPDLRGMAPAEAERAVFLRGLELSRNDHFYSAVIPAGRIVSQEPEPGTRVRRGWQVRAAESLGPQIIEIPAIVGLSQRAAEIDVHRRGLELGAAAELPTGAAAPQVIIAQTPAPGAQGVASPRISLLYAAAAPAPAYVMPDLTGMTLAEATALVTASGLKTASVTTAPSSPVGTSGSLHPGTQIVTGQTPPPGARVTADSSISIEVTRS